MKNNNNFENISTYDFKLEACPAYARVTPLINGKTQINTAKQLIFMPGSRLGHNIINRT